MQPHQIDDGSDLIGPARARLFKLSAMLEKTNSKYALFHSMRTVLPFFIGFVLCSHLLYEFSPMPLMQFLSVSMWKITVAVAVAIFSNTILTMRIREFTSDQDLISRLQDMINISLQKLEIGRRAEIDRLDMFENHTKELTKRMEATDEIGWILKKQMDMLSSKVSQMTESREIITDSLEILKRQVAVTQQDRDIYLGLLREQSDRVEQLDLQIKRIASELQNLRPGSFIR